MTQFKMNEANSLEVVKEVIANAKIEGDKIIFNPENFQTFGSMLTIVNNPFQGVSKEIQDYIITTLKEKGVTKSSFSHTPEWAK